MAFFPTQSYIFLILPSGGPDSSCCFYSISFLFSIYPPDTFLVLCYGEISSVFELFGARDLRSTEPAFQNNVGQGGFHWDCWSVRSRRKGRINSTVKGNLGYVSFLFIIGERLPNVEPVKWQCA